MTLRYEFASGPVPRETATLLGGTLLGTAECGGVDAPVQTLAAPLPGAGSAVLWEGWHGPEPILRGHSEGIAWRRTGDLLFGVLTLDEADFANNEVPPLQTASAEAYRRIFRLLDSQRLPHLWRIWNYLADINGETHGLERYRQFNIGRQDAFLECARGATGNVPAACALGLAGGPLSIAFLAGPSAAVPLENPRQVSAYHYPAEYGPRSPTFSRAALVHPPGQEILFISGTAAIVGHRTVHAGDVEAQCRETLANIAAVVDEANRQVRSAPFALDELVYRVYLRQPADHAKVQPLVAALTGARDVVYVVADVCRADLLLEIEAFASHPLEN